MWLPDDLVLCVLMTLRIASLLQFRQACKHIYSISLTKQLWVHVYFRDIVAQHLPFAGYWKNIDDLTASQLERLVLHVLRLNHRLRMHSPPIARSLYQRRSVTWVRLVQSQWLLVASSDDVTSIIALWSVSSLFTSKSGAPLAEASLSAPVVTGVVEVIGSSVTLAVELCGRTPQILVLNIAKHRHLTVFSRLQTLNNISHLRFLRGDYIGVSLVDNINVPCLVDWKHANVVRLRHLPDLQGGAVAMHMSERWVVVVRRGILEGYVHDGQHYKCWRVVKITHSVGTASFVQPDDSSAHSPAPLKLCITCTTGLFVYEILCRPDTGVLSLNILWHHNKPGMEPNPMMTQGMLGCTGGSVSWLWGSTRNLGFTVRFATARLPIGSREVHPTIFEWQDVNMPALYSSGVYDYDDARGVLILGNAYGELSLYDFSRSDPRLFRHYSSKSLAAVPHNGLDVLPAHRIPSYPAPPFPHWEDPEYVKNDLLQSWREHGLIHAPPGWSTDFVNAKDGNVPLIYAFLGRGSSVPCGFRMLENAAHFYGRPIPLLHTCNSPYHYDLAIVDVGGLLFMRDVDDPLFYAVNEGITLEQLVASVDQGWIPAQEITLDVSQQIREIWSYAMMDHERKVTRRNRCLELYRRGGRVNGRFLKSQLA
ncbi:hypothetical protein QCA50_016920 [Cerrena zonata]|uniref:F-box domain-containing protein n=1 Tax=Cerrena zonata TaxID=2478898 RepID=A0AAW0FP02_9APHY